MSGQALPPGWTVRSLMHSGKWAGGGTPSKQNAAFWTGGDIPWVSPKDMKQFVIDSAEDLITGLALADSTTNLIPSGSVLLVTRSGILQRTLPVGLTVVPVAINQDMKALTPDEAIRADFLARFLVSQERQLLEACRKSGTTVASLETDKLMEVEVPVPPLNEQKRIVAKLEAVQARAEAAKAALDAVGGLLEKFRQSVLAAAFRGDLTRAWRAQNPNTEPASALLTRIRAERRRRWQAANPKKQYTEPDPVDPTGLPDLPEGWCWASVDELTPAEAPPVYGIIQPGPHVADGVPFVRPVDIRNGEVDFGSLPRTSVEISDKYRRSALSPGDLVYSIVGTIGKWLIVPKELAGANITQSSVRIRPIPPFDAHFILRAFQSPLVTDQMGRMIFGNAVQRLNIQHVRELAVPVPPRTEWNAIQQKMGETLDVYRSLTASAQRIDSTLGSLTQATLAKAFRGELVPQHPDDEPASALLARIAAERTTETPKRRGRRPKDE